MSYATQSNLKFKREQPFETAGNADTVRARRKKTNERDPVTHPQSILPINIFNR